MQNQILKIKKMKIIFQFNEKLYDSLINSSNFQFKNNKKKYFIVKTELRNGFIFGELLNHFTRIIDKNQIMLQIASISDENIPKNILTKKDMSGNSIAIYKLIMNEINEESFPTKEELNCKNNFDESPELFSIALNKPKLTKKLLSLPNSNFSSKTEGGLTPLALSLINDSREETKLLLNNIHKIGDLNSTNELGLTYLHLAVISDNDFAVKILLENNADISIKNRKESNNPIHLMAIFSRNEIISNIINNQQFRKNINSTRADGKNALHFISSNSILGTKLLLSVGADFKTFDKFGNTQAKYAFFSGRFDCYDLLIKKTNNKHDLLLKKNVMNMILNSNNDLKISYNFSIETYNNNENFNNLFILFEQNDCKNALSLIKLFKKNNIKLDDNKIYKLIEFSCKINSIELLKIVSEYKSLKNFCVGPFIGQYGLISWINELSNLIFFQKIF